jgi:hypothetical protein
MKLSTWKRDVHKVFVYRNLQQKCWSVRSRYGANYGRVILHAQSIALTSAHFSVNAKGRQRVLDERQKNVHAGVVGYLSVATVITERYPDSTLAGSHEIEYPISRFVKHPCAQEVTYNPYKFDSFVNVKTEQRVTEEMLHVTLDHNMKVWYWDAYEQHRVA